MKEESFNMNMQSPQKLQNKIIIISDYKSKFFEKKIITKRKKQGTKELSDLNISSDTIMK